MVKAALLCAGLAAGLTVSLATAQTPVRSVDYLGMYLCPRNCPMPIFDKGYLIQMNNGVPPDGFSVWNPEGREMYQVNIVAPDGEPAGLRDAAVDSDGTVGTMFSYLSDGGHRLTGVIELVDLGGKHRMLTETGHWMPVKLGFAPDHSIWVMGMSDAPMLNQHEDYKLVRKYSPGGKLEGEFVPRSMFPTPGLEPANTGIGWIRASNDRVGALLYPGTVGNFPEWVELNFDGKILGRWKLGPDTFVDRQSHRTIRRANRLVFTSDARLLAETTSCSAAGQCSPQFVQFDEATSTWKAAATIPRVQVDDYGYLFGTHNSELAFEQQRAGLRLSWFPLAK